MSNGSAPTLAANVMHFARMLRRAGLPVGPAETLAGQQALSLINLGNRTEARTALRTAMIHRHEHQDVFDQAFNLFWRDPTAAEQAVAMALLEAQKEKHKERPPPGSRRVAEAMAKPRETRPRPEDEPPVMDAVLTVSERERLQNMDFEAMSAEEIAAAKREIRRLVLPLDLRRTRRLRADPLGPVTDLRRTIRQSLRQGGEILTIARERQVTRPPPLVVLCDISGSMSRYAQILLHFLHAVTNDRDRVQAFLFGTRLTNVTRQLRHRDAGGGVPDGVAHRAGLVGWHANRRGAGRVQPPLGATGAGAGGDRAADHGRPRSRWRPRPCRQHGSAASFVPAADLAQSAVALERLRAKITGDTRNAAARGRLPPRAQPGQPARAGRSPVPSDATTHTLGGDGRA